MKGDVKKKMSSNRGFLDFLLEQLSLLDSVRYRAMMGEYIIYYKDKVVGGIYDDRFMVKLTKASRRMMPEAEMGMPYKGANEMIIVDNLDDREFLKDLFDAMYDELPFPRKKKS